MKKRIIALSFAVLLAMVALCGCGKKNKKTTKPKIDVGTSGVDEIAPGTDKNSGAVVEIDEEFLKENSSSKTSSSSKSSSKSPSKSSSSSKNSSSSKPSSSSSGSKENTSDEDSMKGFKPWR